MTNYFCAISGFPLKILKSELQNITCSVYSFTRFKDWIFIQQIIFLSEKSNQQQKSVRKNLLLFCISYILNRNSFFISFRQSADINCLQILMTMMNNDPIITYDHTKEESSFRSHYFKKSIFGRKNTMLLFFAEELLILGFMAYLVYLVFV